MAEKKTATVKKTTEKKEIKLNPLVWEIPYNKDLIAQVLYIYSSNERKGTIKQKSRSEVSGGGRKPWRQKGTGRARHGSIRSPLWIGGGVTFALAGRNFKKKLNKKMARKATKGMLSERLRNNELEFVKMTPTQAKKLRENSKERILLVTEDEKMGLILRNSKKTDVKNPAKLNAKHLVSNRKILVDEKAINVLEKRLLNEK